MKYFSLFVLFPALACAASYTSGQAARLVIGQNTFTAQDTGTTNQYTLGAVGGVAYANNTLFIADSNRVQATPIQNRVLIYQNISNFVQSPTAEIPQGVRCPVCAGGPDTRGADVVLGQPDFVSNAYNDAGGNTAGTAPSAKSMRTPTGVASDGNILAVADTDNNRVLIWKSIPTAVGQPADVVVGQADFVTVKQPPTLDNKSLRGPQGLWIQGTKLYVADTLNHRVMVWNNIPGSNNQPADLVLGQPNFNTASQQNPGAANSSASATDLLNPVSVTSDGQRLYVTDLGHNRVLIWNTIPTQNDQAADVVLGQADFSTGDANNVTNGCVSTSTDADGNPVYPSSCTKPFLCASTGTDSTTSTKLYPHLCETTLNFPRFALSDGQRLYVADGGNDRILIYNSIPTQNAQPADEVLGQRDFVSDQVTDSTDTFRPDANITRSSPQTIRTPSSLAWDGQNLYAADPYDMRVLVFTPAPTPLPITGITNSASRHVFAVGTVDITGTITAKDTLTITIAGKAYTYTVLSTDTLSTLVNALVNLINANSGDPNVIAIANPGFNEVILNSKVPDVAGNSITLAIATTGTSSTTAATETLTLSGATLSGGNTAAEVAPGTLVSISGTNLADAAAVGQPDLDGRYPTSLGGVEVYMDGIKSPLLYVSPTQINTQVPFDVQDASGISTYVVSNHSDGSTTYTTSVNVPIVLENPGIFALNGQGPRPVIAFHTSSNATAVIDVGGTIKSGDAGTITINGTPYAYTVTSSDTLSSVETHFINLINADSASPVTASAAGEYNRIILSAKVAGPDGNGISVTVTNPSGGSLVLTALQASTCCASVAGAPVNNDNPAVAGEIISIYAAGIGLVQPDAAAAQAEAGLIYNGPPNNPTAPVDNAQVGGSTANVLNAGLVPGMVGVYEVQLQLNSSLPTNPLTQLFIAQNVFTSNIVTIPVVAQGQQ